MNIYIPYTRLPSEYQEVEYIENTGTTQVQYIDTGVTATANISMELVVTPNTSYTNGEYAIMGTDWTSQGIFLMFYNNVWRYHQGGSYGDISGISEAKTTVAMSSTGFSVNGTSTSFSAGSDYTRGGTILLFTTRSVSTNPSRYKVSKFKTHELKIWDSGTLVRDLVPCYRKSDSVIGMYDIVNDQFYTNSGTGTFSKGNDVTMSVLKNDYIGEYGWTPGVNTVAYYPFRSDILDHSGNNNNFTGGAYTFSNNKITVTSKLSGPLIVPTSGTDARTIIAWITAYSQGSGNSRYDYATGTYGPNGLLKNNSDGAGVQLKIGSTWYDVKQTTLSEFSLIVLVKNGNKLSGYVNGNFVNTVTMSTDQWSFSSPTQYSELQPGTYGEIIVEDKAWTDSEIPDYYNQTKSNYGL